MLLLATLSWLDITNPLPLMVKIVFDYFLRSCICLYA
uniref:Uncharacterized protein n=1 Tax=Rhizophora mucronata TaxID=61149 RepID=A0A2P2PTF4_RHIMU